MFVAYNESEPLCALAPAACLLRPAAEQQQRRARRPERNARACALLKPVSRVRQSSENRAGSGFCVVVIVTSHVLDQDRIAQDKSQNRVCLSSQEGRGDIFVHVRGRFVDTFHHFGTSPNRLQ